MGDVEWTDEAREAAVDAAARRAAALRDQDFDDLPPMERYAYREAVLPIVTAAMNEITPHVEVTVREARGEGRVAGLREQAWQKGSLVLTPGDLDALIEAARADARKGVRHD